jgi:hypothetical protein
VRAKEREREEARATLREIVKPGSTVYTVLRSRSRSGMNRKIDVYAMEDNEPRRITYQVAKACEIPYNTKAEALSVSGCGMDMGFHVVYELSHALYGAGFGCIGKGCPSNDHSNGDRDYTPHPGCGTPDPRGHRDHWHRSGGYALKHRWM